MGSTTPIRVKRVAILALIWVLGFAADGSESGYPCGFPAIYNFGDSNSDTGARSAAFGQMSLPYGMTFFEAPAGRVCDGRLMIDFIAQELKLPYLSAYLDSVGTSFRYGANFAFVGSSILPGGYSPFHLGIQISQFKQLKSRSISLYDKLNSTGEEPPYMNDLPRPEDFSKALYTIDIGQNDISYSFQTMPEEEARASIPDMINHVSQAIHLLYNEGARYFWVHNTGPFGCLPNAVVNTNVGPSDLDESGCVILLNEISQEFNRQLKHKLTQLQLQLPQAAITHVDVYSAKYALISDAKNQGFVDPVNFCCGNSEGGIVACEMKTVCDNPSKHISWDSIHYTEAANSWVASRLINGSFSDPPVAIRDACHRPIKSY